MNLAEEFSAWARDPHRTNEELYLAELLIEAGHEAWKHLTKAPWVRTDYDAMVAHRKRRLLNPAYRPKLSRKKLDHTVEVWAQIEGVSNDRYNDRPVRDLSALRFFPHLTKVELCTELADLSGLNVLQSLRVLDLRDAQLADLSPLAKHPQLENLTLWLEWPWPSLACLAALTKVKKFSYRGNLLVLADVTALPAAEQVALVAPYFTRLPLRALDQAPAMPVVRQLELESTADLRGLERYDRLEKLKIEGPFEDLSPVATLQHLRELTIKGERFLDLSPLARLPRLRTLELERERGLDLTPLSDSPSLREVKSRCEVLKTELATLNAALGFVDVSEFLAPEPRPVRLLRFISWRYDDPEYKALKRPTPPDERTAVFGDDPLLKPAEQKWFADLVREKLNPFGDEKWIELLDMGDTMMVKLFRPHETFSLRQMVDALHPLLALTRFHWEIMFFVELNGDPDEYEWERPDHTVFDAEREREEWEDMQQRTKERQEMLEREHQLNLQKQQGIAVDTRATAPDEDEPEEGDKPKKPAPSKSDDDDDDDDGDFVDSRSFRLWINRDIVWMHEDEVEEITEFLGRVRVDNWHQLPEPRSERPYLHDW